MKTYERITLVTAGMTMIAAATYLTRKVFRARVERLYRVAAGESSYERKHAKLAHAQHA